MGSKQGDWWRRPAEEPGNAGTGCAEREGGTHKRHRVLGRGPSQGWAASGGVLSGSRGATGMHAGWWRTTRPRQCCSKAGHPRLAGLYLRRGNECVAVFPQLRSPAVPWISCAHEAGRRCQGAPHPPPPPLKGGDWIQPRTPAPSLASCSAVYPSCPRLSWALWVWLSGVSGPVCGQIGLGRASWRAASGAAGVQGHLGGSLGCRARMPCSCVFFPMLFGGPKAWEVHSCVHGAHTLPTPSAAWPATRSAWRPWPSSVATRSCRAVCSSLARTSAVLPAAPPTACPSSSRSASLRSSSGRCAPR